MAYILYYLFLEFNCSIGLVDVFWQRLPMRYKVRTHMRKLRQEIVNGLVLHHRTGLKAISSVIPPHFRISDLRFNYVAKAYYAFDSDGAAVYRSTRNYQVLTRQEWINTIRKYISRVGWIENFIALLAQHEWQYTRLDNSARKGDKDYYLCFVFKDPKVKIYKTTQNDQISLCLGYSEWTGYSIQESPQEKWANVSEEEWRKRFGSLL